ncbi:hypothetical protein ACTWJ8_30770 [Streptomyces sp. SDT5-1]
MTVTKGQVPLHGYVRVMWGLKATCPVSQALTGTTITLTAKLGG